jgi:hypothetical protein
MVEVAALANPEGDNGWVVLATTVPTEACTDAEMIKRSRRSLVSSPITCWSVMRSVSTPRGMKRPQQPKKTPGTFRPLERGFCLLNRDIATTVPGVKNVAEEANALPLLSARSAG